MQDERPEEWAAYVEEVNDRIAAGVEKNVAAQARFVNAWFDALDETTDRSLETLSDGFDGYSRAYRIWMEAAADGLERVEDAVEGEEVGVEEFRDIWLNSANEAFKAMMGTTAFASLTGESVEDLLDGQQAATEAATTTLRSLGVATAADVDEVGARLVELERRQHAVEQQLDRLVEAVEQ